MANLKINGNLEATGTGKINNLPIILFGDCYNSDNGQITMISGLNANVYYKIQWGVFSKSNTAFTFPYPFDSVCYQVLVCGSGDNWEAVNAKTKSKTGFTPTSRYDDSPGRYIAIGK
jgi:hypothetical protein